VLQKEKLYAAVRSLTFVSVVDGSSVSLTTLILVSSVSYLTIAVLSAVSLYDHWLRSASRLRPQHQGRHPPSLIHIH